MGTGQMMLTIAAMFLLSIVLLSANATFLQNDDVVKDSEFGVAAISLATSLVEEVQGKYFDAATSDSGVYSTDRLTGASSFGPNSTEEYRTTNPAKTDFNDVDDFHNFSIEFVSDTTRAKKATYRGDSKGFRADYLVKSKVNYVSAGAGSAALDGVSATRTWHKKLVITVTSPSVKDSLVLSTVISYWN